MDETNTTRSEFALLRQVAVTGDARASAELVNRYQNLAYSAAMRVLGNQSDAEDVTQETFIRFFEKASAITVSIGGWLHRCATDLAVDLVRSRDRRVKRERGAAALSGLDRKHAWEEASPVVDSAINELPDELRQLMIGYFLERRTQAELARMLAVSVPTVCRRIDDGVMALRSKLRNAGYAVECASLASLLAEQAVLQAPAALAAELGKIALTGFKTTAPNAAAAFSTKTGAAFAGKTLFTGGLAMKTAVGVVLVAAVVGGSTVIVHKVAAKGNDKAPLGSESFYPSPERPVGWRGDWTGRYPGATPPVKWSRRVAGITSEIYYQAGKPAAAPGKDSRQLEYFTIKDWLVAGPFSAEDAAKGLEQDFLGGPASQGSAAASEDKVQPDKDAKAGGDKTWKYVRAGMDNQSRHDHNEGTIGHLNLDYVYLFGKINPEALEKIEGDFTKKVAYAHTYIYSPKQTQARLHIPCAASGAKFWLNGKPTNIDLKAWGGKIYDVTLQGGWNRLLIKTSVENGLGKHYGGRWVSSWTVAAYIMPPLPVSYETRNIAWMTKMTGRSMSGPIIVGDRIFVGAGTSDLMCIGKKDGRIMWLRSNTPYDAIGAEEKAAVKDKMEPLSVQLNRLNEEVVKAVNAAVSPRGLSSDQAAELDKKIKEKQDVEKQIHKAFVAVDGKKYPPMDGNEVSASNGTPVSDGSFVYWACGGGMKGPGAYVVVCFDLEGKRVWSWHSSSLGAQEHGTHTSLALVDGKLIYAANKTVIAFDAKTGKESWRNAPDDWQNGLGSSSPVIFKTGNTDALVANRYIHRVSDGKVICSSSLKIWGDLTPIVEDGVAYNSSDWQDWGNPAGFAAVRLPGSLSEGAKAELVWQGKGREVAMPIRYTPGYTVASPLYVDGIVYTVEMSGGMTATDVKAKKSLYRQWLDGYNRYNRYLYGVSASPALGGKNIYVTDDAGYTHVIQPGPQFKELAQNIVENIHQSGHGGNPCHQESFYTAPFFEGAAMYLRGEEYLYCIRESAK